LRGKTFFSVKTQKWQSNNTGAVCKEKHEIVNCYEVAELQYYEVNPVQKYS